MTMIVKAKIGRVFALLSIWLAWNLPDNPATLAQYVYVPKWVETAKVDVVARAFADTNPANQAQLDDDRIRQMLVSLLVEKFQI